MPCCQAVVHGKVQRQGTCILHARQVRDAVITMLDDWIGERGRVPLERLAPAVHDVTVAPKMSPEGRTAAIAWLRGALAAEQVLPYAILSALSPVGSWAQGLFADGQLYWQH